MTQASDYLQSLGKRVLEHYTRLPGVACAAIIGSAAEGLSDTRSDLDLAVYYDTMPPEADLSAIALRLGGGALLWKMGTYADGEFAESFRMDGVECQVFHTLVTQWERSMEQVLQGHEPGSPLHKAMSGLLVAVGVMGAGRLEQWKSRAA